MVESFEYEYKTLTGAGSIVTLTIYSGTIKRHNDAVFMKIHFDFPDHMSDAERRHEVEWEYGGYFGGYAPDLTSLEYAGEPDLGAGGPQYILDSVDFLVGDLGLSCG